MANNVEIGPSEINKALSDAEFFRKMPEFAVLRVKMDTAQKSSKRGCTPCRMRRIVSTMNSDFMRIIPTLSDDGKARFKKYFGADTISYNKVDRVARKVLNIKF